MEAFEIAYSDGRGLGFGLGGVKILCAGLGLWRRLNFVGGCMFWDT